MNEDGISGRTVFLCSVDAFVAGLLFTLAILLALLQSPSDFVGVLTDIKVHFYWDSRALGLSGAATMLAVAAWRSWRIYQSKVITGPMQLGLGLLGCALVSFRFFLFVNGLSKAIIDGIM
ncbi:hypothetical protein ACFPOU_15310 [Massilia jejuensis]|uniref:Uncharacterized protein n=1 Tax=Massilia jejuensis TaxID=648894 RepID=A0ABW0PIM0_9BURK